MLANNSHFMINPVRSVFKNNQKHILCFSSLLILILFFLIIFSVIFCLRLRFNHFPDCWAYNNISNSWISFYFHYFLRITFIFCTYARKVCKNLAIPWYFVYLLPFIKADIHCALCAAVNIYKQCAIFYLLNFYKFLCAHTNANPKNGNKKLITILL